MLRPFLHKVECESLTTFYFRHFKELDALFGPVLLKVKSGRFDGILIVAPLLTYNASPSVTDSLVCGYYPVTFGLPDVLPSCLTSFSFIELAGLHFAYTP